MVSEPLFSSRSTLSGSSKAALDRYIAVSQIGITLSSLILGAYGQATLPQHISPLLADLGGFQEGAAEATSALIILVGLTMLQVIFGELLPKSISLQYPAQTALFSVVPMAADRSARAML